MQSSFKFLIFLSVLILIQSRIVKAQEINEEVSNQDKENKHEFQFSDNQTKDYFKHIAMRRRSPRASSESNHATKSCLEETWVILLLSIMTILLLIYCCCTCCLGIYILRKNYCFDFEMYKKQNTPKCCIKDKMSRPEPHTDCENDDEQRSRYSAYRKYPKTDDSECSDVNTVYKNQDCECY